MFLHYGFLILVYQFTTGLSAPATATYDQRQTGDLNVQIHLKDIKVVALLESELLDDYTDYDYLYDYADFTVKPITKPTTNSTISEDTEETSSSTPISSETTDKVNVTESLGAVLENSSSVAPISESSTENAILQVTLDSNENATAVSTLNSTNSLEDPSNTNITLRNGLTNKIENLSGDDDVLTAQDTDMIESSEKPVSQLSRKRCKSGYSPDGKGRCRRLSRRRLSLIPFALKLAPKLLDASSVKVE